MFNEYDDEDTGAVSVNAGEETAEHRQADFTNKRVLAPPSHVTETNERIIEALFTSLTVLTTKGKRFCFYDEKKRPCDKFGNRTILPKQDPETLLTFAALLSQVDGALYPIGCYIMSQDGIYFFDMDKQKLPDGTWSPLVEEMRRLFPDAYWETSKSGNGLHSVFKGDPLQHGYRDSEQRLELYGGDGGMRLICLTAKDATGNAGIDCTAAVKELIKRFFSSNGTTKLADATNTAAIDKDTGDISTRWERACAEPPPPPHLYTPIPDDDKLIKKMCESKGSPNAAFADGIHPVDLWENKEDVLAGKYPSPKDDTYNRSDADFALACILCFWTGNDAPRIERLVLRSGLRPDDRSKYEHDDYLHRTILKARTATTTFYNKDFRKEKHTNSNKPVVNNTQPLSAPPIPQPETLPELPPVMSFNFDYLPEKVRPFVQDIAYRMQCVPDFPAVGWYEMVATIIGRKVGIRPKKYETWTVTPNLWGAIIGDSGVKKTPALQQVLAPLKKLEKQAYDDFTHATAIYNDEVGFAQVEKNAKKLDAKKALREKNRDEAKARELLKASEAGAPPILKRYISNNASYEALGEILMENQNGIMMLGDELIGILKRLDMAGQEAARAFFLTAANGDQSYTFDRILRGKGLRIPAVCLSMLGCIQPGVLADYVRQATNGGAGADGLLQRFGLLVYPDRSGYEWVDTMPDIDAQYDVDDLITRLDQLNPVAIGAESDQHSSIPFLRLDDEARKIYQAWDIALNHRIESGEEHPALKSHFSKYRDLVLSIALINHLCDSMQGAVTVSALNRAINFVKYLESHARRVYSFATRPDIEAAKILLNRLNSGKLLTPFTTRSVYHGRHWTGLETAPKAQAAINVLLEYGHLTEEKRDTGGCPITFYSWVK